MPRSRSLVIVPGGQAEFGAAVVNATSMIFTPATDMIPRVRTAADLAGLAATDLTLVEGLQRADAGVPRRARLAGLKEVRADRVSRAAHSFRRRDTRLQRSLECVESRGRCCRCTRADSLACPSARCHCARRVVSSTITAVCVDR